MLSRERIAFAGDRCTVKFMVLGVMVVDKARLLHHPATGRVGSGVAAGQPVTTVSYTHLLTVRNYELSVRKADAEMIEVV